MRTAILTLLALASLTNLKSARAEDGTEELDQVVAEPLTKNKKALPRVLDFEAEVIEGERKTPNLFLQLEMETPNLDTVMYQRKNFNDFFQVELERKPSYKAPEK